jgi:DNA-binding transcriptional ArsR family regulator
MSNIWFEVADLADIRFGISPLWETMSSLWALGDPARHAIHLPWIKQVRPLARRADMAPGLAILRSFTGPGRWLPDFLTPRPAGPLMDIETELATLAATPPEGVAKDLYDIERNRPLTPFGRRLAEDPVTFLPAVVEALHRWFEVAIAPEWPRVRALLEADVAYRARQLADGGPRLLFNTLAPAVTWCDDRIEIVDKFGLEIRIEGRGFTLTPSVFADGGPLLMASAWTDPATAYPARAVGTLWEGRPVRPGSALAGVFGAARARLLTLAETPSTTTDLAARTGLTPGAVSQHLAALQAAGLVARNRQGRAVYYSCTDVARNLLRVNE